MDMSVLVLVSVLVCLSGVSTGRGVALAVYTSSAVFGPRPSSTHHTRHDHSGEPQEFTSLNVESFALQLRVVDRTYLTNHLCTTFLVVLHILNVS